MPTKTVQRARQDPVRQFSIFIENKAGRLLEIINLLESHNTHAVALMILDTTDSSIVRVIFDDPDRAYIILQEHAIPFNETEVIVVETNGNTDLTRVLAALLRAEVNILYAYPFLTRPGDKSALVLSIDDFEVAIHALSQERIRLIHQSDIAR